MKENSGSSRSDNLKMRISKSEIKALIEQEVCKVQAKGEARMKMLVDTIQNINHDINFENSLQKLESQIELLSKRAEAAFAFITKTQNQGATPSPGNLGTISGSPEDNATETTSQMNEKNLECVCKSKELVTMMEMSQTALKQIRVDNELVTAAMAEISPDVAPVVLPSDSCTETNLRHSDRGAVMADLKEEEHQSPLLPTVSSQVCTNGRKRGSEEDVKNSEQPVKRLKGDCSSPVHSHTSPVEQDLVFYPALPIKPFPSVLSIEAASYSLPQKVELNLALIRNPTRLSVLWNVVEEDPTAPPMDSYTIFLTVEKVKGSGVFSKWRSYEQLKATSLPMCALIKKYKPGHKVCAAVVGKDIFGRYGPNSRVVTALMPD